MHLLEREVTIAEVLGQAGYGTAHFGKWHIGWDWAVKPGQDAAVDREDFIAKLRHGLDASPATQVLVEASVVGYKKATQKEHEAFEL